MTRFARCPRWFARPLASSLLMAAALSASPSFAQTFDCDMNLTGAFDYVVAAAGGAGQGYLRAAENAHFRPQVEHLVRGLTSATPGPDLEYLLRRFPNHLRALVAMSRLAAKTPGLRPTDVTLSIECFFERALAIRRSDPIPRILYADFLSRNKQTEPALGQLAQAARLAVDHAGAQYSIGLAYLQMKQYDQALEHAHRARALGDRRDGLQIALTKLGKWREMTPPEPATTPPSEPGPVPAIPASSPTSD